MLSTSIQHGQAVIKVSNRAYHEVIGVITRGYWALQGITGGYKGLQRDTRGYRGLQTVTKGYRGLKGL